MDRLALKERQKYEKIWRTLPEYRVDSPADFLTPIFLLHFQKELKPAAAVSDWGCGPGRSAFPLLKANRIEKEFPAGLNHVVWAVRKK